MIRRKRIDALDVALGEVPEAEQAAVARRLREDEHLRAEVDRLAPVVARLERHPAASWEPPEPPPLVVGAPLPGTAGRVRRWRDAIVLRPAVALAASFVLVAGGTAAGLLAAGGEDGPAPAPARAVELGPLEGEGAGRAVLARQDADEVRLQVRGLEADRAGSFHELWLLPDEGQGDPVAVGRFRIGADGRTTVTFRLPDDPDRYRYLDVSVEPADGDETHSGRSVLRAPV